MDVKRLYELKTQIKALEEELAVLEKEAKESLPIGKSQVGNYIINVVARENVAVNDFDKVKSFLGKMRLSGTYLEQKLNKEFNVYYKTSESAQKALGDAVELKVSKSLTIKEAK
jgi:hypothetical protein